MRLTKYLPAIAMVVALVGCGGGGSSSASTATTTTPGTVTTPVELPASVEVLTSSNTLTSAGSEADITVFVKSSANIAMAGQTVSFSASSGILKVSSLTTDANGVASAKLSAGNNKSIRDITVTATAGTISGSVIVPVVGTTLSITGSGSLQAGGPVTQYTVRALDSSNNSIRDVAVNITSTLGNSITPKSLSTDAIGNATFLYTPNVAGKDTLTVSGLGTTSTTPISINAIDFIAQSPSNNTSISVGSSQIVSVRYQLSGVGVAGKTVSFTTTRGNLTAATSTTDASGIASVGISSTTAGPAIVIAQIADVGQVNLPLQFVATVPKTIILQSNPGAILPNSSGTINQSTVEAVVRDAAGNAVANRQVNFSILQDVSNGTLSSGVATTDSNGRAQVQFISGAISTPTDGVIIKAEVASTTITDTTKLTVNGKALFISLGFGSSNAIIADNNTAYSKPFSVYVTDANGVAVGNQAVSLSVIPDEYYKGSLIQGEKVWKVAVQQTCPNEDINLNGILDSQEDTNKDLKLTPGNMAVVSPGIVKTNDLGRATFDIQYGKQYALWTKVKISARASVGGTESKQFISVTLPVVIDDVNNLDITPANWNSPFGTVLDCTKPN